MLITLKLCQQNDTVTLNPDRIVSIRPAGRHAFDRSSQVKMEGGDVFTVCESQEEIRQLVWEVSR